MRKIAAAWMVMCVAAGCARGQAQAQPPPAAGGNPAPASMPAAAMESVAAEVDPMLDALDRRGKELNDFTADVSLTNTDIASGDQDTLSGKIWMQRLPGNDARLRVNFDKKIQNEKTTSRHLEYVLSNGTLTDRDYDNKMEVQRQVLKPGQKMDLLKLGEGPFPLPLGQDKADVHKMFTVRLFPKSQEDPANAVHLQLRPKPGTQFESKFASIDFWVDTQSNMPIRIQTEDPNGTTTKLTELKNVQVNSGLAGNDFTLDPIDPKTWTIRQQSYEE